MMKRTCSRSRQDILTSLVVYVTLIQLLVIPTSGHGRFLEPPSRQSAWRFGYRTPANYDDHGRNCGGREHQWITNNGRCGVCGDPADGPLYYERPDGLLVQHDVIPRNYTEGQSIFVRVEMTVNHKGWFEFRLCDIASTGGVEATQECLDRNILPDQTGETRFEVLTDAIGYYDYNLKLPDDFVCAHCMVQWKWHCGNSPGHGEAQEEFYGCSDVSIYPRSGQPIPTATTVSTSRYSVDTTPAPVHITTKAPVLITTREPVPMTTRAPIPITTRAPVPITTRNPMPIKTRAPVPITTRAPIPITTRAPIPITTRAPIPITSRAPVPITTRAHIPITTRAPVQTTTTRPGPFLHNNDILNYLINKPPHNPGIINGPKPPSPMLPGRPNRTPGPQNPGQVVLPGQPYTPSRPAKPGLPEMGEEGQNTLCRMCRGNGCRYAGCTSLCPSVCS